MKLRTQNGKWIITHGNETIIRNSSAEAWQYIFDNYKK
jgi:hypothetical protein